jgi:hypothetical protein
VLQGDWQAASMAQMEETAPTIHNDMAVLSSELLSGFSAVIVISSLVTSAPIFPTSDMGFSGAIYTPAAVARSMNVKQVSRFELS